MIASVHSVALTGFQGTLIEVETDMKQGLPGIQIVGMGNKAVDEARERIRSAIRQSLLDLPARKYTLNLAPADLPKDGAHFDLALAVSLLVATGQVTHSEVADAAFAGELSLSGLVKPIRGALAIAGAAKAAGLKHIYLPMGNAPQAQLLNGITVHAVPSLRALFLHLKQLTPLLPLSNLPLPQLTTQMITFNDIAGQPQAKRALQIAIAGRHNILLYGPPGVGKTLLAKSSLSLLPPLSDKEKIAVTQLHSLSGEAVDTIVHQRPFRAPHHSISPSAFIGGGARPRPGEISLAHHGVLYLDEVPEFHRTNLEALRQPLEERTVSLSRLFGRVTYPADIMVIGAMNPCPCGYYGDPNIACTCSNQQRENYRKRLSGPLLDRIDIVVKVSRPDSSELLKEKSLINTQHAQVLEAIIRAQRQQKIRYNSSILYNAHLTVDTLNSHIQLNKEASLLITKAAQRLALSARSTHAVLKVARTIADLAEAEVVDSSHISEALQLRGSLTSS